MGMVTDATSIRLTGNAVGQSEVRCVVGGKADTTGWRLCRSSLRLMAVNTMASDSASAIDCQIRSALVSTGAFRARRRLLLMNPGTRPVSEDDELGMRLVQQMCMMLVGASPGIMGRGRRSSRHGLKIRNSRPQEIPFPSKSPRIREYARAIIRRWLARVKPFPAHYTGLVVAWGITWPALRNRQTGRDRVRRLDKQTSRFVGLGIWSLVYPPLSCVSFQVFATSGTLMGI
ncbi:uncharacterized protein CLUP02_12073 [Colletotrichum lupini]|uniref:Uncharacterized protein n=1 Tax=Colletotrichum lupini TaxID=145971 RepID=A0A9Q8WKF9_9PEZI|nr:uncharacterized protein CLUP02_12073 [Colletotrichum lupini]KAK1704845.1 hypothetical protein BDP67DRAFT_532516 [Colletotrichum lupini]UQC86571.1 hypothetical protein CLUP02_12073 [Colletotrichum lupini]